MNSNSPGTKPFPIPVRTIGPGSQSEEEELQYMSMPKGMNTYQSPILPEREQIGELHQAQAALRAVAAAVQRALAVPPEAMASVCERVDLSDLDEANRRLVNQVLGEGEVGARIDGEAPVKVQESLFAGIWRVAEFDAQQRLLRDYVEIAAAPALLAERARPTQDLSLTPPSAQNLPPMVMNAPAILTEVLEKSQRWQPGMPVHVINLTLLPLSPQDITYLDERLGVAGVNILSRGYGNCRVSSTQLPQCWRVVYYNSQDAVILDTIEITSMPEAVRAAPEDLSDSAERFAEVLEWVAGSTH